MRRADVCRIGYFGSLARGDWGVGSDVDLVVVLDASTQPFVRRAAAFDTTTLPVPADLLVYTLDEWQTLQAQRGAFAHETVWIYQREET